MIFTLNFIKTKKLNQKGFSHHLLLPVAIMLLVGAIGTYVLKKSHAEPLPVSTPLQSTVLDSPILGGQIVKSGGASAATANATVAKTNYVAAPNIINYPSTIKKGSTGVDVREAQWLLNASGYEYGTNYNLARDGSFGNATDLAVRDFQSKAKVAGGADGIIGPNTWKALMYADDWALINTMGTTHHAAAPVLTSYGTSNGITYFNSSSNILVDGIYPCYQFPFSNQGHVGPCGSGYPNDTYPQVKGVIFTKVSHGHNDYQIVPWIYHANKYPMDSTAIAGHATFVTINVP